MTEAPTTTPSWRRRAATIGLAFIIFGGFFVIGRTSLGDADDEAEVSVRPGEARVTLNAPGRLTVAARIPNLIEPPPPPKPNNGAPAPAPATAAVATVPVETAPAEVATTPVAPIPAPTPAPAPPAPAPPPDNGGGGSGISFDDSG